MKKILTTPIKAEDLQDIRVGDVIYLTGTLVTCRDVCHRRLIELKRPIPYDLNGKAIFHAGPIVRKNGDKWEMVSVGPTTSMRMESFEREFIEQPPSQSKSGRAGATPGRRTQPSGNWPTRADWQQFSDGRAYRICRPPSVNHRRCCFYRLLGASSRHTAGSCRSHL